jgi:hypothetical protein
MKDDRYRGQRGDDQMSDKQHGTADQPLTHNGYEPYALNSVLPATLPPFTVHAEQRQHQRAIPQWAIDVALRAWPICSHGALIYRVTDRLLLQLGLEALPDRLRGLTVVTGIDGAIITVKWDARLRRRGYLRRSRLGRRGTMPLTVRPRSVFQCLRAVGSSVASAVPRGGFEGRRNKSMYFTMHADGSARPIVR